MCLVGTLSLTQLQLPVMQICYWNCGLKVARNMIIRTPSVSNCARRSGRRDCALKPSLALSLFSSSGGSSRSASNRCTTPSSATLSAGVRDVMTTHRLLTSLFLVSLLRSTDTHYILTGKRPFYMTAILVKVYGICMLWLSRFTRNEASKHLKSVE